MSDTRDLMRYGLKLSLVLNHRLIKRFAYSFANLPLEPRIFVVLISGKYRFSRKYFVNRKVLLMHCKALFIKQVFPRFCSPVNPSLDFSLFSKDSSSSSDSETLSQ